MLFDPKWKETKADPLAIATLIAWLETMPAGQEYCYLSSGGCLFGQYFTEHGLKLVRVGGWSVAHGEWTMAGREEFNLPHGWDDVSAQKPHTYGGALNRARKLEA